MKGYWVQRSCAKCHAKYWGNVHAHVQFLWCRPCVRALTEDA